MKIKRFKLYIKPKGGTMNSEKKSKNILGLPDWAVISIVVVVVLLVVVTVICFVTPSA